MKFRASQSAYLGHGESPEPDAQTFSMWRNKPRKFTHTTTTLKDPSETYMHIQGDEVIDGVTFISTSIYDLNGKLREKHLYRADTLIGKGK